MNNVAIYRLAVETLDNRAFAVLNIAITGSDHVPKKSDAYVPALEARLIEADGRPNDLEALREACKLEAHRRIQAGAFKK